MADHLVRATGAGGSVRALAAVTTSLVAEAARRHHTSPLATVALGRALTGAALLGANLKGKEKVTLRIEGGGPLGAIVSSADGDGNVRGYVGNPGVDVPDQTGRLDVGVAVGRRGFLHLTRDMGLQNVYTGTSALVTGEIAEDLTHYFWNSEQVPSAVALGVLLDPDGTVRAAGGYMVQLMPAARGEDRDRLEQNLQHLGTVSLAVDAGLVAADLVRGALGGLDSKLLDRQDLRFRCRCSPERVERVLLSLGAAELRDMLERDGRAELRCEFCAQMYPFAADQLARLLDEAERKGPENTKANH